MRQFLLAKDLAYATQVDYTQIVDGAIGVFYIDNGEIKSSTDGTEIVDMATLVLGRKTEDGGAMPVNLFKNHFTWNKSKYIAPTVFKAQFTITAPNNLMESTIIIAKHGIGFNERNKWTISEYAISSDTIDTLRAKLINQINKTTTSHGIIASQSGAGDIALTGTDFTDYTILLTDALTGTVVNYTAKGYKGINTSEDIIDMFSQGAADAGFGGTYEDNISKGYPIVLTGTTPAPDGYDVINIRFAEPRLSKTVDELIYQIIQIAFPKGASGTGIVTLETILTELSK